MESSILQWLSDSSIAPNMVMGVLFSAMTTILFLQSGLDKVFNWNGEVSFYQKTF